MHRGHLVGVGIDRIGRIRDRPSGRGRCRPSDTRGRVRAVWAPLSTRAHADDYDPDAWPALSPMRRVVEVLADREDAFGLVAFTSPDTFGITPSPSYEKSDGSGTTFLT